MPTRTPLWHAVCQAASDNPGDTVKHDVNPFAFHSYVNRRPISPACRPTMRQVHASSKPSSLTLDTSAIWRPIGAVKRAPASEISRRTHSNSVPSPALTVALHSLRSCGETRHLFITQSQHRPGQGRPGQTHCPAGTLATVVPRSKAQQTRHVHARLSRRASARYCGYGCRSAALWQWGDRRFFWEVSNRSTCSSLIVRSTRRSCASRYTILSHLERIVCN